MVRIYNVINCYVMVCVVHILYCSLTCVCMRALRASYNIRRIINVHNDHHYFLRIGWYTSNLLPCVLLTAANSVRIVEVSRTCIQPQRSDGCFDTTWNGISVYACACNTDYCNAANPTRSSLGGVLLRLLLATAVWLIQATIRVWPQRGVYL